MGFPVVLHKDRALTHHLEVSPFPSNFSLPSVPGLFLRADEELVRPGEVVDIFKANIVDFNCVVFQVQVDSAYPLGFDYTPDAIDFYIVPII